MLLKGNCLELLAEMPDNSVDSIVTDPPYELGFMGKSWDNSGIAYNVELWSQALRVLKPGGHLLAFGGSRTYHRLASAVEDAGFEIRDQIMWLYGSGFPKSLDVSKAIDKASGFVGEVIGKGSSWNRPDSVAGNTARMNVSPGEYDIKSLSPEAQTWQGWGTALKPAHEPIVVARKPLIGTVATNVLTYGTGALNIDGSRVASELPENRTRHGGGSSDIFPKRGNEPTMPSGRWPANVIHDGSDEVLEGFPSVKTGSIKPHQQNSESDSFGLKGKFITGSHLGDSGSAARFFYCAKASKSERNAGLEGLPESKAKFGNQKNGKDLGNGSVNDKFTTLPAQNFHPTVKPIALMRYLVKLVTPPNGTVLDPFLGSGTTAVAAILEGFNWMGCEMTEDYWPIIEARVAWAEKQPKTLL
jgi:site-specific DNA-methyltransferase (adenine-specific)